MLLWEPDDMARLTPDEEQLFLAERLLDIPPGVSEQEYLKYTLYWDGCEDPRLLPGWVLARHDQLHAALESPECQARMRADSAAFMDMVRRDAHTKI
jgi:hypothetical protein